MKLVNVRSVETLADRVAVEIVAHLARRGHSRAALARALDKSPMWVSERLSGKVQLTINDVALIADALGVGVVDLLPVEDREVTVTYLDALLNSQSTAPVSPDRPISGRPPGQSGSSRPPSGPRRTSRVYPSAG